MVAGLWGEALSEFLGTFVLVAFGDGVVAMTVAGLPESGRTASPTTIFKAAADWLPISWGWGLGVVFGVYVAGGISGAHINPAVTFGFALRRKFPWRKVPVYWLAQLVGAFVAAALVYAVYQSSINAYAAAAHAPINSGHAITTFSIFATFPAQYFPDWVGPFVDQVVGTGILLLVIVAILDKRNTAVRGNLAAFMIGLLVVAIGLSFGANAGYAINPARDLGPRIAHAILPIKGKGSSDWSYSWVPVVGPFIGAAIAALAAPALLSLA